jgi:TPR repeat protein
MRLSVTAGVSIGKRPEWLKRHSAAARKWLLAAADAGHIEACFQLALWADENEGTRRRRPTFAALRPLWQTHATAR